jgi:hypothetical protein
MSDNASSARRRLSSGRRVSAEDRHGRHLELVTDRWIAELAELVVLTPRASRAVGAVRARSYARRIVAGGRALLRRVLRERSGDH